MNLAELLEQQRRMAIWTLLHSLMILQFYQLLLIILSIGLTYERWCRNVIFFKLSTRNRAVPHGFCLRHGFTEHTQLIVSVYTAP
ncbi:hypothetical protein Plhal703r1_c78g0173331 [Plasmopara halstedii]